MSSLALLDEELVLEMKDGDQSSGGKVSLDNRPLENSWMDENQMQEM